jgi:hypothetical protein
MTHVPWRLCTAFDANLADPTEAVVGGNAQLRDKFSEDLIFSHLAKIVSIFAARAFTSGALLADTSWSIECKERWRRFERALRQPKLHHARRMRPATQQKTSSGAANRRGGKLP